VWLPLEDLLYLEEKGRSCGGGAHRGIGFESEILANSNLFSETPLGINQGVEGRVLIYLKKPEAKFLVSVSFKDLWSKGDMSS
jgi:hypothetical protein